MLNRVQLIGHTGQEVEVKHFDNGGMVAKFSLATTDTWKNKDGEKQSATEWHNIQIFGKLAEIAEKYVKKGDKLYLEGKLKHRSYEIDGTTKYITEVVLEEYRGNMIMLGGNSNSSSDSAPTPSDSVPSPSDSGKSEAVKAAEGLETDDLPF
jgi:single-strand DNA-binding protein